MFKEKNRKNLFQIEKKKSLLNFFSTKFYKLKKEALNKIYISYALSIKQQRYVQLFRLNEKIRNITKFKKYFREWKEKARLLKIFLKKKMFCLKQKIFRSFYLKLCSLFMIFRFE